ncbi:restriction endonuclease subunit S [Campylobacter upsaliensis]|nr:restriction endonuclease subunit S [Campylobacter upsaliensis]
MSSVKIVQFKDLSLWDLKSNVAKNEMFINSKFPLVEISKVLSRNKTSIKILDSEIYKRVTIKTKAGGCHLRDILKGNLIKTKNQFLIKQGQFLISKIDARNGAFGVVGKEIDNAIITGNFWTYDVDTSKVNRHFLNLLINNQIFIEFCESCSSGTTGRRYLDEYKFLNAKIPLPPLEIQNEIINKLKALEDKIKALQEEKAKLENEINEYIYIALGLEKRGQILNQTGVKIVRYKDLKLFDYKSNALEKSELKSTYKRYQFSDFLTRRLDKIKIDENTFYKRVTIKTKAQGCHLRDTLKGNLIKTKNQFLIKQGQFLISKIDARNGAFGIAINDLDKAVIMADFLNYDIDKNIINDKFLIAVLKTPYYMEQLNSLSSGTTGRKRINEQKFSNLCISLPPLKIQNELMLKLTEVDEKIENLSKEFSDLKNEMIEGLL